VCAKPSWKDDGGGTGGCLLIGTVLFESLLLVFGKCQGFKYSTPKGGTAYERKHSRVTCDARR